MSFIYRYIIKVSNLFKTGDSLFLQSNFFNIFPKIYLGTFTKLRKLPSPFNTKYPFFSIVNFNFFLLFFFFISKFPSFSIYSEFIKSPSLWQKLFHLNNLEKKIHKIQSFKNARYSIIK